METGGFAPIGLLLAAAMSVTNVMTDVWRKRALDRRDLFPATFWIRIAVAVVFALVLAVGVFELDTGAMLTIDTAWCTNGEELSVHGTKGRFTYHDNKLALCSNVGAWHGRVAEYSGGLVATTFGGSWGEEQQMEVKPPGFADIGNKLNQHLQFLEAVRDGKPAPVSIASGVRDLRVVAALYESARSGRAVECA
jgi:predicted dehydrogenase